MMITQAVQPINMPRAYATGLEQPKMGMAETQIATPFSTAPTQDTFAASLLTPPYKTSLINGGAAYLQQAPGKQLTHLAIQIPLGPEYNTIKLLLADLLMNGSPQTKKTLEQYSRMGIDVDVTPMDESIQLNVHAPTGYEPYMAQSALQILSQPQLDEKFFGNIKNTLLNNLDKLNALPEVNLSETISETIYGQNHPYAKTIQSAISEVNAQSPYSVLELYRGIVSDPSRIRFCWVSPQPIQQQLNTLNNTVQQYGWYKNPFFIMPLKTTPETVPAYVNTLVYKLLPNDKLNRAHLTYAWHAPKPQDNDYLAFKVLEKIMSGMSSDFFQVLRNQKGLVYSTSRQYTLHRQGSEFTVTAQVNLDKVLGALKGVNQIQDSLANANLTNEGLFRAKKTLQLELREAYQSTTGANFEMTQRLENGLQPQHPNQLVQNLQQITLDDVKRVAKKVFSQPPIIGIAAPKHILRELRPALSESQQA